MSSPSKEALPSWFGDEGLFGGLSEAAQAQLLGGLEARDFAPGELLFDWGDQAHDMLYIVSGEVSVFRPDGPDGTRVEVNRAGPGRVLGELTYVDDRKRSASGRAVTEVQTWRLPFSVIRAVEAQHPSTIELYRELAHQLAHKVRTSDDSLVAGALELSLAAKLLITVITIQSGTLIATGLMTQLMRQVSSHTTILLGYLVFVSMVGLIYARHIKLPLRDFGLTMEGWRPALRDALVLTLVAMLAALLLKWAAVTFVPGYAHLPIFDYLDVTRGHGRSDPEQLRILYWSMLGYTLAGGFQELYARGMLQGQLHRFFRPRFDTPWPAIIVSNFLFASIHVSWSMTLTVLSFAGGLLWGWLYGRRQTLVGVTISHIIIGIWVLKILSIQGLLVTGPFAR